MTGALLHLQQCSVRFGGLTAVSAFDLQIGAQDMVGLIGPNGAGKTTVFNIITGVYRPTSGSITFGNVPIAGLKPSDIARRGIARTFQNIRLFPTLTVFDNVRSGFNQRLRHGLAYALWRMAAFYREEDEIAREVDELLEIFDLGKFRDALCTSLSYGDQRRLEIVRGIRGGPSRHRRRASARDRRNIRKAWTSRTPHPETASECRGSAAQRRSLRATAPDRRFC